MQVAHQAPVVQKVDNAIHWINLYLVDRAISKGVRCLEMNLLGTALKGCNKQRIFLALCLYFSRCIVNYAKFNNKIQNSNLAWKTNLYLSCQDRKLHMMHPNLLSHNH